MDFSLNQYTLENYYNDIKKIGLKKTWNKILEKAIDNNSDENLFSVKNFGELYEAGLAFDNKISKKEMGKYYTPCDVADIMSNWFSKLKGENICDVGCGVGNLILNYLSKIEKNEAYNIIKSGKIYLYDKDEIALDICKFSIAILYGKELINNINTIKGDFLNKKIVLPKNSKVISNPPYFKIIEIKKSWQQSNIINDSKELYSAFMEKIIKNSESSVIITPYSFMGATKFYSLRKFMNNFNGFIVSFDNVPGNIFCGKKHGIFNSNNTNSVRAAITVVKNEESKNGFRLSPLIRFKTEERKKLLDNSILEKTLGEEYQIVDSKKKSYFKCFKQLNEIRKVWEDSSEYKIGNHFYSKGKEKNALYMPTTCRYFTVGSKTNLDRCGKRVIYIEDENLYNYIYCMLNSSFAYWYWRLYDGGINCPLTIISSIPSFYNKINEEYKNKINEIAKEMQENEKKYFVYKVNAGKKQENIKFPIQYRNKINKLFFEILNINEDIEKLNVIHSSSFFNIVEEETNE